MAKKYYQFSLLFVMLILSNKIFSQSNSIKMEQKAKNISIKKDEVKASVETSETKQIIELLKDIQTKLSLLIEKVS